MTVTVGCDPEGFAVDNEGNPVPLCDLLGGDKGNPKPCDGGGFLEDNVMFELNPNYAATREEFLTNVKKCMKAVEDILQPLDLKVDITPERLFDSRMLEHPKAMESGCEPDYNAWKIKKNPRVSIANIDKRFASGNVHIGWDDPDSDPRSRTRVVRYMDVYHSLPLVMIEPNTDRRKYYGKAGSHRPKPYGVEVRTTSNTWLTDDSLILWTFDIARSAGFYEERGFLDNMLREFSGMEDEVERIINNNDKHAAHDFVLEFNIEVPEYVIDRFGT